MVRAVNTPVTPDDRIWPIVIFSGRFIAGGRWMSLMKQRQPDARAKERKAARRAGRIAHGVCGPIGIRL
jgi:hypothetical protein